MAIARDATSSGAATATSLTVAHTCSGSNRILFVNVVTIDGTTDHVTGVTYNGVAMTRQSTLAIGTVARSYMYYLLAPATGANNVVISVGASVSIQSDNVSYNGVSQSGFPDASSATTASAATTYSNTLTTIADNAVHVAYIRVDDHSITLDSGGALVLARGAGGEGIYESSPLAITPAASHSIAFSTTPAQNWAGIGVSIAPTTELTISVSDAITITESVTMEVNSFIDVSDAITITESVTGPEYVFTIDVFDSVILTESVTVENSQLGDISVNDAITLTESVTVENSQLGDIDVSDTITIADVPTIDFLFLVNVSDDITISESVEIAAGMGDINVSDTITITESVTMFVPDLSSGIAIMRSEQQQYPLGMDDETIL